MKPSFLRIVRVVSRTVLWVILLGLYGADAGAAAATPRIELTDVPAYGTFDNLRGRVTGVEPAQHAVAVYIYVSGWWTKPYWASPLTPIRADGSWECDVTTGGYDSQASRYMAYLVPADYDPPSMGGGGQLPAGLEQAALAKVQALRLPEVIISPALMQDLQDTLALIGRKVTLRVTASGSSPMWYRWYKDGVPFLNAQADQASLILTNAQAADSGRYYVEIENLAGRVVSREATLAVVPEVTKPSVRIVSPRARRFDGASLTVSGTARDNKAVARVEYQLNEGPFRPAAGTTNWSAEIELRAGPNVLAVRSIDSSGNTSRTVRRTLTFVVLSPLTVRVAGEGTVAPDWNGQWLEIGRSYALSARAAKDHLFAGWSGDLTGDASRLPFQMQSNLVVQANFLPNPFLPVAGYYHGLFHEETGVLRESSGYVKLVVTKSGRLGGRLRLAGESLPLVGRFDLAGNASVAVKRTGRQPLTLQLHVDLTHGSDQVRGRLWDARWEAGLIADRGVFHARTNPAPMAGAYTFVIPGHVASTLYPGGHGFGTATVTASGRVVVRGRLAEGTGFRLNVPLSKDGHWPFYVSLYRRAGAVLGWVNFLPDPEDGFEGMLNWAKPRDYEAGYYPVGFEYETCLLGAPWASAAPGGSWLTPNAVMVVSGAELPGRMTNALASADGSGTPPAGFTVSARTGRFTGHFVDPVTRRKIPVQGVLMPGDGAAYGFFLRNHLSGSVAVYDSQVVGIEYQVHGLNFSPYVEGQDPNRQSQVSEGQLRERLGIIASYTRWIRTFGSTGGLEAAGRVAREYGLNTAVGAWLSRDPEANAREIANLIQVAQEGHVDIAIVGNEVLLRGDLTEAQLLGYIDQVRQAVPGLPITTSEVYGELLAHPAVLEAVDVVFGNFYPYWEGVQVSTAVASLHDLYGRVVAAAGDKPVVVAETGWPSAGNVIGKAVPSVTHASLYFQNFVSWARAQNVPYFYFSALDEAWKASVEGPQGAHWGVWDQYGNLKPGMARTFAGRTLPDNWSGTQVPGGEGEPAIEFTFVPAHGSEGSVEGQVLHVRPGDYRVAVYIEVFGEYWAKPSLVSPLTVIQSDGTFVADITTGGVDTQATRIVAYLLPAGYSPPTVAGAATLPPELTAQAVAWTEITRNP